MRDSCAIVCVFVVLLYIHTYTAFGAGWHVG